MKSLACVAGALALLAGSCSTAAAQSFNGMGQQATGLFPLNEGLAVWDLEYPGAGRFAVRLLDERGTVIEPLVDQLGPFTGSRAVRVPRPGRYLLDVSASGPWSVRLRGDSSAVPPPGQVEGENAARGAWSWGWFARGFAAGAIAAPVGAAVAASLAGKGRVMLPAEQHTALATREPLYAQGFEQGFVARIREQRRKSAIVGGMLGTGVFVFWLLQVTGIGGDEGSGEPPPPSPPVVVIQPR